MKNGLIALTVLFLAEIGTAQTQLVLYDQAANYTSSANKNFSQTPTSWKDNVDSQPASGYTGPAFSYAGVDAGSGTLAIARVATTGRMQLQDSTNFHYMVSFGIAASKVNQIAIDGSTFGAGVAGDDTYLVLHDSTQTYENGWYAALLHSRTVAAAFSYTTNVAYMTWHQFTPSIVDGVAPLGTIGSAVDISVITGATFDEVGYYADVYDTTGAAANHYLWYLAAYAPSANASLELGELAAMYVDDTSSVATGTVSVSYTEGIPPTNVTITAVSVVDQTHPGAFANLTSLPLALTSPSPATETISIEFDNTVANLADGETATGVVEIVWNEVGSASSSTSTVPVSATSLAVHNGNIIAVFDETFVNADRKLQGLVARISGGNGADATYGCNDTTYGTLSGNAPTDGGSLKIQNLSPEMLTPVVVITNNTGSDVVLDSLHFDVLKRFNKTPGAVNVSISGDVSSALLLSSDTATNFTVSSATLADYDDFDITLTNLADHTLANGESLAIEFAFIDDQGGTSPTLIDNIALLGSGMNGASLTKVPGGAINMPVSGLTLSASELIKMVYTAGDTATNVVITGVSFADETLPGAFGWSGSLPLELAAPDVTNSIVTLLFDNTVANLAEGASASATMEIAWNEIGLGSRTYDIAVSATRPADVPTNTVLVLFHSDFLVADAAANGVLGSTSGGNGVADTGSFDGTFGSLATLAAPTTTNGFRASNAAPIVEISVTNQTVANIDLSTIHFDVGRNWLNSPEAFILSVDGDVTANSSLLVASNLTQLSNNYGGDADDFDVDLTGLADHTLAQGESAVFTITFDAKVDFPGFGSFVDNIALMGTFDTFGGWAADAGLILGVNDGPNDNPDNDGMDNLMEFATGNDPLVADGPAADNWQSAEGGTNWFYHVHTERTDDPGLGYSVGAKDNLVYSPEWSGTNVEYVGESSGPGIFRSVTNRTDIGTVEFIELKVEQN